MNVKKLKALAAAAMMSVSVMPAGFNVPAASAKYGTGRNVVEYLDRGLCAINTGSGMMVSWRFLANDPDNAEFRLYRDSELIYESKENMATSYLDKGGSAASKYRLDTLSEGKLLSSDYCSLISNSGYFDIPLDVPKGGTINGEAYTYSPNDCCAGDVDGDGQYEIFVKWDPSNSKDNSQVTDAKKGIQGVTGNVYIDCYTLDGRKLWRIDMGRNIRAGQHYTQMAVADFDLDGKAEFITKTCDGTVDGTGKVIGNGSANYVTEAGTILTGPEYMTLFDGATGAALDTIEFPVLRGDATSTAAKNTWGDNYGNRCERYNCAIAYLDGVHPSAVYGRGYYTRLSLSAVDVVDKKLVKRWVFDTGFDKSNPAYGCGNHNVMVADFDNDGKQEVCMGACAIDDNGQLLWSTKQLHGDAMHVGDLVPEREGQEVFICHEDGNHGISLLDGKTGQIIWHYDGDKDTGRCCADNILAGNAGAEFWGSRPAYAVYDVSGTQIGNKQPSTNFLIYWDGDLERELLNDIYIDKMVSTTNIQNIFTATGCASNNGTKAVPCMTGDLLGDWREELVLRTEDNTKLRIYCTPHTTETRLTTLMHDVQYRMQCGCQQSSYNQPPHTSFFLGTGFSLPERPDVKVLSGSNSMFSGELIQSVSVNDKTNRFNWSVQKDLAAGDTVFGDRAFKFTAVPDALKGAEWIRTACDSKKFYGEEAVFKSGKDITAYIGLDSRVTETPDWLAGWERTDMTLTDDGNPVVTYIVYKKDFSEGSDITLGQLANASVVNYVVMAKEHEPEIVTTTTTTTTTTTSTTTAEETTTVTETDTALVPTLLGDANCDRQVNIADAVLVMQVATNPDKYAVGKTNVSIKPLGEINADVDGKAGLTNSDALLIQQFKLGIIKSFPVEGD
jgi:rhamnogalacturonan endolyase